ncbi:hypothetical protein [Streptomyces sp. NPDC056796]|uniref:hypothetical protein n=1 Tax=Streptomyces sp. NPDC056796 TaxID=3345947 RepID=UPI00369A3C40
MKEPRGATFLTVDVTTTGYVSSDRMISIVANEEEEDFHIDARRGYAPSVMREMLRYAAMLGLEPLDEDECEPEILADGTVRIYCAQVSPPPLPPQIEGRASAKKRTAYGFTLAACVVGALLAPSPLRYDYTPGDQEQHRTADPRITDQVVFAPASFSTKGL